MKQISLLVLGLFFSLVARAVEAEPIETCLENSKQWIFRNFSVGAVEAGRRATQFCAAGGDSACLEPAQSWIARNTLMPPAAIATTTLDFCRKGKVDCLEPAKLWIYRNGGVSITQAAEDAVKVCAQRGATAPEN